MGAPAVIGHGALSLLNPKQRLGFDAELICISYALGIFTLAALSCLIELSGLSRGYANLLRDSVVAVSLSSLALVLYRYCIGQKIAINQQKRPISPSLRAFNYLVIAMIAAQGLTLLLDNYSQSIWAWDSIKFWINRSAAWYGADAVGFWSWTGNDYELKYYSDQFIDRELPLVSLTFLWAISLSGSHTNDLVSLPAIVALIAICGLVYSQTLKVTRSVTAALLACLMTSTIPLLTTHAVSAGYADIWLSLFITTFITVAFSSSNLTQRQRVLLLLVILISMAVTKEKGILYAGYCCASALLYRAYSKRSTASSWKRISGAIRGGYFLLLATAVIGILINSEIAPTGLEQPQWARIAPAIDYVTTLFISDSWGFLLATLVLQVTLFGAHQLPNLVIFSIAFILFLLAGFALLATFPSFSPLFYDGTTFDRTTLILVPQAAVIVTYYFHQALTQTRAQAEL